MEKKLQQHWTPRQDDIPMLQALRKCHLKSRRPSKFLEHLSFKVWMTGACDKYRTDRKHLTNISDSHNTQRHIQTHEEKEDPWRRFPWHSCTTRKQVLCPPPARYTQLEWNLSQELDMESWTLPKKHPWIENKLYWNKVHLFGRPDFSYWTTQLKMQSKSSKNHITICLRDWKEMKTLISSSQLGI